MKNKQLVVAKNNDFIQAKYRANLDEMRIFHLALGVFDPEKPSTEFEFTVDNFIRQYPDVNPDNAYKQVQKAIKELGRRWVMTVDNDIQQTEVTLLTKRTYFKKEGRFVIEFHKDLLPYITDLKNSGGYTSYRLKNIAMFKSFHTIRLYELLAQYKKIGERYISIEDLKKCLQLEERYDRYNNLNQRVLKPSLAEINEKSDLYLEYEPIKRGRKIVGIEFSITYEKPVRERPPFPHKNKYGRYVKLDVYNPKMSSHEYGLWAKDCLKILEEHYTKIEEVTLEDLRNYWVFLAGNESNKSKLGTKSDFLTELKRRGYKLELCELVKIDPKQTDLVDVAGLEKA